MCKVTLLCRLFLLPVFLGFNVQAQHLWWNLDHQNNATCLYGEVTVLATYPAIYYCGANWHPGEAAGGYCGIQDNSLKERRTIFSVWDTSPTLHPKITQTDQKTVTSRFTNEGEGAHTHMLWKWKVEQTFQFFVQKTPGRERGTTDASYYIFDRESKRWLHSATINSPNDGKGSVSTIGGGLNSFLENFEGKDTAVPRLALYRLWLGPNIDSMHCLTRAGGDGMWGTLDDDYFLATGDRAKLDGVLSQLKSKYGESVFGGKGIKIVPISDKSVPAQVIEALKKAIE